MADFKKLRVWQKAHALSLSVDRTSKRIRASQYASVRNQIFRAAVSVPANIAEGRRQRSEKEFGRFLGIALSSTSELEYHLIFARDTKIIPESEFVSLISQTITVRKMLYALLKRLGTPERESIARKFRDDQSPEPPAARPTAPSG
jgi:four helix bundle protein